MKFAEKFAGMLGFPRIYFFKLLSNLKYLKLNYIICYLGHTLSFDEIKHQGSNANGESENINSSLTNKSECGEEDGVGEGEEGSSSDDEFEDYPDCEETERH